ncbi:hypothetical protein C8R45DRAFT_1110237 [Mycena sanguinolenta]|nr:hypothetical protein C8R45DRAFT_1110237 [Mycena sanguinolenta]
MVNIKYLSSGCIKAGCTLSLDRHLSSPLAYIAFIVLCYSKSYGFVVTKEEFETEVAATYAKYNVIETPPAEKKILADLLGLTPEALGKTAVWFPDGGDVCASCGHAITFLDVAEGGLKAHSKEFMADIITGKHGYVLNSDPQPISCHSCGAAAAIGSNYGYTSGSYHCKQA